MKITVTPKEISRDEVVEPIEIMFAEIIVYIEYISEPGIYWKEKFLLLSTYNRGIKDGLDLFHKVPDRMAHIKDQLSAFIFGTEKCIDMIIDMMDNTKNILEERHINIEKMRLLLVDLYMKGISSAGRLYRLNMLDEDTTSIIEAIDSMSTAREEEQEEVWENIRNRLGMGIDV